MADDALSDDALLKLLAAFNAVTQQTKLVYGLSDSDPVKKVEKLYLQQVERQLWARHAEYTQKYGSAQQHQLSVSSR